ncbi:hypothetical protein RvY_13528 [Ramazzottius varieornatus]|uniref:Cwf19-like C-terminal domain-containing protein n=1 Tax=Ramazzottius varieornatus TaxID=947166 RepID=A0A1D1VN79_RAMVA|nr:hypothetical protein RvY_13528 [Ramazzottius varieornatus]
MSKVGNVKLLVIGDVHGHFNLLVSKITALNQKNGPFEAVFCVGSFFGDNNSEWSDLEKCIIQVPVPTYILGPIFPEHAKFFKDKSGEDLVPNVTYLGRRGIFTFTSGLKVAYLSGAESSDLSGDKSEITFTQRDVEEVVTLAGGNSCIGFDLLLTSQWPANVELHGGNETTFDSAKGGSALIAQLAVTLKPRYHFSAIADTFYERLPYRNHQTLAESATHPSRFVALASVGNAKKGRYVYAFNIVPMSKISFQELRKQPDHCTPCPYAEKPLLTKKDKVEDIVANQYFYDMVSGDGQRNGKRQGNQEDHRNKKPRGDGQPEAPCWFCLSSPDAEKHLVVSVGLHSYVALAKGGLTPEHVLIMPIFHLRSYPEVDDETAAEIEQYKAALIKFFSEQGKSTAFFERNFKSKHMQLQVVPVPQTDPERIKDLFLQRAEESQLKLTEIPSKSDLRQIIKAGQTFFSVELDNNDKLFYKIDQKGFPLQFGREVLAGRELLNMPDRVDWRECKASKEEETRMANNFKIAFKPYDFNFG